MWLLHALLDVLKLRTCRVDALGCPGAHSISHTKCVCSFRDHECIFTTMRDLHETGWNWMTHLRVDHRVLCWARRRARDHDKQCNQRCRSVCASQIAVAQLVGKTVGAS